MMQKTELFERHSELLKAKDGVAIFPLADSQLFFRCRELGIECEGHSDIGNFYRRYEAFVFIPRDTSLVDEQMSSVSKHIYHNGVVVVSPYSEYDLWLERFRSEGYAIQREDRAAGEFVARANPSVPGCSATDMPIHLQFEMISRASVRGYFLKPYKIDIKGGIVLSLSFQNYEPFFFLVFREGELSASAHFPESRWMEWSSPLPAAPFYSFFVEVHLRNSYRVTVNDLHYDFVAPEQMEDYPPHYHDWQVANLHSGLGRSSGRIYIPNDVPLHIDRICGD